MDTPKEIAAAINRALLIPPFKVPEVTKYKPDRYLCFVETHDKSSAYIIESNSLVAAIHRYCDLKAEDNHNYNKTQKTTITGLMSNPKN